MIYGIKFQHSGHACTKIIFEGYEISIAMDDSCGCMEHFKRTSICIYQENSGVNVTNKFFKGKDEIYGADANTLCKIIQKIKRKASKKI